jgi:hypothetical protein
MPSHPARVAALATLALVIASCGSSQPSSATSSSAGTSPSTPGTSSQALVVAVTTPKSAPTAGGFWPITVRAHTAAGAPASGTVSYAFRFGEAVVARRPGGQMRSGVFHDRLEFPAQAVGYPLTVQVNVQGPGGQRGSTGIAVTVRR